MQEHSRNLTQPKQTETALHKRLLHGQILKDISSCFVGPYPHEEAVESALYSLAKMSGADNVYIVSFNDNEQLEHIYVWPKHLTDSCKENLKRFAPKPFEWWRTALEAGNTIEITDLHDLEDMCDLEKEILCNFDVKNLLILPLKVGDVLSGFICLHTQVGISWPQAIKSSLKIASDIIGSSLQRERAEKALRESEAKYRTAFENSGTIMVVVEEDMTVSLVNDGELHRILGYSKDEVEGRPWTKFIAQEQRTKVLEDHHKRVRTNTQAPAKHYETQVRTKFGEIKDVLVTGATIPGTRKEIISVLDITERKRAERELEYLSYHDTLTGLFNRRFFEQEMNRLEEVPENLAGIVICDIDGLKLVNDTLGHAAGDALLKSVSDLLRETFLDLIVARIGGDEFAVLVEQADKPVLEWHCALFKEKIKTISQLDSRYMVNASLGLALRDNPGMRMHEVFREADNNMYREKLHHAQSKRSSLVLALTKALEARDFITEGHAERLQSLVLNLAEATGLSEGRISDLLLFAQFHDIGKVGIPDAILFKPSSLNDEERSVMQRHSEIGFRITQSCHDLLPIADWVLKHHERWDGKGYPLGIKGEEIPFECRILAIADAYDAMTNDRPYRAALGPEEAVAELEKCAGSQFDPFLVKLFIEKVNVN